MNPRREINITDGVKSLQGRCMDDDVLRKVTLEPESAKLATDSVRLAPRRPRHEWTKCLYKFIRNSFGSDSALADCMADERTPRQFATRFALGGPGVR